MIKSEKIKNAPTRSKKQNKTKCRVKHATAKPLHRLSNSKETKKDEFRKSKETGHPAYIYALIGHNYKFLGLTHTPIEGVEYEEVLNPSPKDRVRKQIVYISTSYDIGNSGQFSKKYKDWKLTKADKEKLKPYLK